MSPDIYETQVRLSLTVPMEEIMKAKELIESNIGKIKMPSVLTPSEMPQFEAMKAIIKVKRQREEFGKMKEELKPTFLGKVGGIAGKLGLSPGMMGAAGAAGAIVMSSPMLQNTLKQIVHVLMLILRPIGDIIAVGLRPIIDILKPIGMFFRILMAPYIRKANEAMKLGRGFLAKGETGKAGEAYALGAAFLLKPFFDMMVTIATISIQGILAGIKVLGMALISLVPYSDEAQLKFQSMMDNMILFVGEGGATIIRDTSLMMEEWLVNLKISYKSMENVANVSMSTTALFVGEAFIDIIRSATLFFAPSLTGAINESFDNIISYARQKVTELNALLGMGGGGEWGPFPKGTTVGQLVKQGWTLPQIAESMKKYENTYNFGGVFITTNRDLDEVVRETENRVRREVSSSGAG